MQTLFGVLMFISSLFLILLVLVQRGRGGGLSGAFGGLGGQSAFGAKAGDTFTRVTIVSAAVWILLCMLATGMLGGQAKEKSVFSEASATDVIGDLAGESDLDFGSDVPPAPVEGGDAAAEGAAAEGAATESSTGEASPRAAVESEAVAPEVPAGEVSTEAAVDPVTETVPVETVPAE